MTTIASWSDARELLGSLADAVDESYGYVTESGMDLLLSAMDCTLMHYCDAPWDPAMFSRMLGTTAGVA